MTRFLVRKLDPAGVSPLGNLIKADVHHLVVKAGELLAQAEEQGRRTYEEAREQGRKDGEAEGRQAGAELLADTAAEARGYWQTAERRLVAIVMEAVRRIIGEFDDAELTAGILRQMLVEAEGEGRVRIHVSPGESRFIQDSVREMRNGESTTDSIEVIADSAIPEGACRMETEVGFVETSVDAQLGILEAALEKEIMD